MFVGDGVNDSLVLTQSEIGVAINAQADITVQAASIVCLKPDLTDVVNAILISRKTMRRIKINFVWAFVYNAILVPIAMGFGWFTLGVRMDPKFAGVAMALSSVSVVASSLLLKCTKYQHTL